MGTSEVPQLPGDVLFDIFRRLPAEDVVQLKRVCQMEYQDYSLRHFLRQKIEVLDSLDGLFNHCSSGISKYFSLLVPNCDDSGKKPANLRKVHKRFRHHMYVDELAPIVVNGVLYWFARRGVLAVAFIQSMDVLDLGFNDWLSLPCKPFRRNHYTSSKLFEMKHKAKSVLGALLPTSVTEISIWILRHSKAGARHDWVKLHEVSFEPIWLIEKSTCIVPSWGHDRNGIMLIRDGHSSKLLKIFLRLGGKLFLYQPSDAKLKEISSYYPTVTCVHSLITFS
ncbi:hypothetical protein RJ640_021304 [Escallonia rubra]|uniref:F-box domain-containing protein n=1 Tax=Escallonia rubra TaxID=112253 RepID=A0AA88UFD3_9ASTE|nr:hypothetical protein RJ640_021304 [Escallonia rubra]